MTLFSKKGLNWFWIVFYKPKQLQSGNIYILCVFISKSPLLSHNFLAFQVAIYAVSTYICVNYMHIYVSTSLHEPSLFNPLLPETLLSSNFEI